MPKCQIQISTMFRQRELLSHPLTNLCVLHWDDLSTNTQRIFMAIYHLFACVCMYVCARVAVLHSSDRNYLMNISQWAAIASHTNELIACVTSNIKHIAYTHAWYNIRCVQCRCCVCVLSYTLINPRGLTCVILLCVVFLIIIFLFTESFSLLSRSLSYSLTQTHIHHTLTLSFRLVRAVLHFTFHCVIMFDSIFIGLFSFWFSMLCVCSQSVKKEFSSVPIIFQFYNRALVLFLRFDSKFDQAFSFRKRCV